MLSNVMLNVKSVLPEFGGKEDQLDRVERGQNYYALLQYEEIRRLEGQMLTIVDASFTDKEQREAVKSIVRNNIWSWSSSLVIRNWNNECPVTCDGSSK